ncbi:FHA domain-containing protein [Calycomorphotria hydatis]|uniref:YscD cytoplasmic domain-containing protein n=1 Tax=Calycomorphotria hydatis TaxID=2528027 RepID=A0A517T6H1_9PLAN|nr:hypothetical protein [Calycomorphotria hydatis]QDT63974.1 hypothetical protein V22_12040 [Calycomorphotria hydatis]
MSEFPLSSSANYFEESPRKKWSLRIDSRYDKHVIPVEKERFLIGTGEACDIQLDSDTLPELFAVLVVNDDSITFEVLGQGPRLMHNGISADSVDLMPGESADFGNYSLTLLPFSAGPKPDGPDDEQGFRIDESITELIEMIEREEEFADDYLAKHTLVTRALLQAIEDAGVKEDDREQNGDIHRPHAA